MKITNEGMKFLTVKDEQKEIEVITDNTLQLEYLNGSDKTGAAYGIDTRLWNITNPLLKEYKHNKHSGQVTLGLQGLLQHFTRDEIDNAIKRATIVYQGAGKSPC